MAGYTVNRRLLCSGANCDTNLSHETVADRASDLFLAASYGVLVCVALGVWWDHRKRLGRPPVIKRVFWCCVIGTGILRIIWFGTPESVFHSSYRPSRTINEDGHDVPRFIELVVRSTANLFMFASFLLIVFFWAVTFSAFWRSSQPSEAEEDGDQLDIPKSTAVVVTEDLMPTDLAFRVFLALNVAAAAGIVTSFVLYWVVDYYTITIFTAVVECVMALLCAGGFVAYGVLLWVSLRPLTVYAPSAQPSHKERHVRRGLTNPTRATDEEEEASTASPDAHQQVVGSVSSGSPPVVGSHVADSEPRDIPSSDAHRPSALASAVSRHGTPSERFAVGTTPVSMAGTSGGGGSLHNRTIAHARPNFIHREFLASSVSPDRSSSSYIPGQTSDASDLLAAIQQQHNNADAGQHDGRGHSVRSGSEVGSPLLASPLSGADRGDDLGIALKDSPLVSSEESTRYNSGGHTSTHYSDRRHRKANGVVLDPLARAAVDAQRKMEKIRVVALCCVLALLLRVSLNLYEVVQTVDEMHHSTLTSFPSFWWAMIAGYYCLGEVVASLVVLLILRNPVDAALSSQRRKTTRYT